MVIIMKEKTMDKVFILVLTCLFLCPGIALSEFVDNGDDTVTDVKTGLMWQQTTSSKMNWEDAIKYCESLSQAGFSDWRLPIREELRSIVNYNKYNPAIDTVFFPETMSAFYWSSTSNAYTTGYAWGVRFYYGDGINSAKDSSYFVRAVRGGQCRLLGHLVIGSFRQGEQLQVGAKKLISWDTQNISGNVKISISFDGGKENSFETIIDSTENDGDYEWTVAQANSVNCVLKIVPLAQPDKGTSFGLISIFTPPAILMGQITNQQNEAPIDNVTITILDEKTYTDSQGNYRIETKNLGVQQVIFSKPGFQSQTIENVEIKPDQTTELNISLIQYGSLTGKVLNLINDAPAPEATITIADKTVQTNNQGLYTINNIIPGIYDITFSKTGFQEDKRYSIEIKPGQTTTLNNALNQPGPLAIATLSLPETEIGDNYNARVRASGGNYPFTYEIAFGKLPPGLSIHPSDGTITGTPTTSGLFTFFVKVTDANNEFAGMEFSINVVEKLLITTLEQLPRGTRKLEYFKNITAKGGTQPYQFSISSGSLPSGLNLSNDGKISGTPTGTGKQTFTIQVTDNGNRTESQVFELEIVDPLVITTNLLNDGIVGNTFDQFLSATGGFGDYQWEIYSGTLPDGLTFKNGQISGTPNYSTYGAIVFSAKDMDHRTSFKDFTFHIADPLEIVLSSLPNALKNEYYSEAAPIRGGIPPFTFEIENLPQGLEYNSETGIISGTPTLWSYNNVVITVSDNTYPTPQIATQKMMLETSSVLNIMTSAVLPRVKKGIEINPIILHAAGGPSPYQWQIVDGYLPAGITLDPETGKLSGTPIDRGDIVMTLQVEDANNQTAQKEFLWHICDTLTISTTVLPDAAEGIAYQVAMKAKGGIPPYSWRFKSGELPSGLSFNSSKGILQGTPSSRSTRTFTIEVNDNDTPAQLTEKTFTMEVLTDDLYIYTPDLPNCRVNTAYSTIIKAALGKPPYTWTIESGQLPPGLTFNSTSDTATLEGTPTKPGTYEFTLKVSDSDSPEKAVSKTYTITIYGQLSFQTAALKNGVQHQAYSDNIIVTGGKLPYIYRIIQGHLPTGLLLDPQTGHISGTLTGESEEFTVQVEDAGEPSGIVEKILAIYMTEGLIIVSEVLSDGMQHMYYQTSFTGQGGIMPYHWSIINGELPKCLNLLFSAGKIYGIPSTSGIFDITVQLSDASEPSKIATQQFQLNIHDSSLLPGDINQDQLVDIKDAILLMSFIADMSVTPLNGAVDINGDCVMGIPEVIYILQHIVMTLE